MGRRLIVSHDPNDLYQTGVKGQMIEPAIPRVLASGIENVFFI